MHYIRHHLTALVSYVTTLTYAPTIDQWAHCLLISQKLNCVILSVQFSYVALYVL